MSMFVDWKDEEQYIIDTLEAKGYGLCSIKLDYLANMKYPTPVLYVMFEPLLCCERLNEAGATLIPLKLKYTNGLRGLHIRDIDSLAPAVRDIPALEIAPVEVGQNYYHDSLHDDDVEVKNL